MSDSTTPTIELEIPSGKAKGIACPNCSKRLYVDELKATDQIRCAGCGTRFFQKGQQAGERLNRKAVWSFVLALLSSIFLVFTGIPAIVLGVLALREKRKGKPLRGHGFAIAGLLISVFTMLSCGMLVTFAMVIVSSTEIAREPEEVRNRLNAVVECKMPRGVEPVSAQRIMGMREFHCNGKISAAHIQFQVMPENQGLNRSAFKKRFLANHPHELESQEVIQNDPELTRQVFDKGGQSKMRRYFADIDRKVGFMFVVVTVQDDVSGNKKPLTEEEVIRFYDSIEVVEAEP